MKRVAQLVFILAFLFLLTPTASAHTDAVSYLPAEGATLIEMPTKVEITFNDELLVLGDKQTSSISVSDSSGAQYQYGEPVITGRTLSIAVKRVDTSGVIKVVWSAVAQDGHRVEGEYSFSVRPSVEPSAFASSEVSPKVTSEPVTTSEKVHDKGSFIQIPIVGALIIIGATLLILRWKRDNGG